MKKLLSVILVITMLFAVMAPAASAVAVPQAGKTPIIYIRGNGEQIYAADGVIYINGYEGEVKVVNVAGQVVKDVNVDGNDTLEVAAGLYIVVTGDQVTKVVVK